MLTSQESVADGLKRRASSAPAESVQDIEGGAASVPCDVQSMTQLELLPKQYLSTNPARPLLSSDAEGNTYEHALKPMLFSVVFILVVEGLERLSFYGVSFTQMEFLTGSYNADWSPGYGLVQASTLVSTSTAIAYSVPFIGAILADAFLGNYWTILGFASLFYLPGLLLIALAAYPNLFSDQFPSAMLTVALLVLYPIGAGAIKGCVNVFGAQQFHPVLQRKCIEDYYIRFYMCINIGALVGGITIPIICTHNVFAAYLVPVVGLSIAIFAFVLGTSRYVFVKPQASANLTSVKACLAAISSCPPGLNHVKESNGGAFSDVFVDNVKLLLAVIPTSALIVPFNIAYSQMATTFVAQGKAMQKFYFVDPSLMQNFDAISVLLFGFLAERALFPFLDRRGLNPDISTKFGIGTALGAAAILCAIIVDYRIHAVYSATGDQISIMWQTFAFLFIGAGEIFAISSAYEAAYIIAPADQKALASAINLFFIGAIPNFISSGLYNACELMAFADANGSTEITNVEDYSTTHIYKFLWILFGISAFGVGLNLLPPVRHFVNAQLEKSRVAAGSSENSTIDG